MNEEASRAARLRMAVVVAAVVVLAVVVGWAAIRATSELSADGESPATPDSASPPDFLPPGQLVESQVVSDREVRVSHWITSDGPVDAITVRADQADGAPGTLAARNVEVYADGKQVERLSFVSSTEQRILLLGTSADQIHLTYDMVSNMEVDVTVPGRALAKVTSLNVDYASEAGPVRRVVAAPGPVLNVACLRNDDDPPRPCGESTDDGGWQVDLDGPDRDDGLIVQLQVQPE